MITLRPDQQKAIDDVRGELRAGAQSVLLRCSTGWGKTVASSAVALGSVERCKRPLFVVHRRELLEQTARTFARLNLPYGMIAAGIDPNPLALAQIASVDTLRNRLGQYHADLVVIDEAHLYVTKTRLDVIDHYRASGAKFILLTATPKRLDGRPMGKIADVMVQGPSTAECIRMGILSGYRAYAPRKPDLKGIRRRAGDYVVEDLEERLNRPSIVGDAVETWRQYANGLRTIVFAFSRAHGAAVCDAYNNAGIGAVYIDGETPKHERRSRIAAFADGKAHILVNIQLCTEGFDLSAQVGRDVPIEAAQFLRPTESDALALQMMGRALRPKERPAVLLDHVDLFVNHGLPDDEREWSLDGEEESKKKKTDPVSRVAICSSCFHAFPPAPVCPYCGEILEKSGRQIDHVEGELEEIDPDLMRQAREKRRFARARIDEERACQSQAELTALGRLRGYTFPAQWARRKWQEMQALRARYDRA